MTENDKIRDLMAQNTNSHKLTSEVMESLTGKPLDWWLEALRQKGVDEKSGERGNRAGDQEKA